MYQCSVDSRYQKSCGTYIYMYRYIGQDMYMEIFSESYIHVLYFMHTVFIPTVRTGSTVAEHLRTGSRAGVCVHSEGR